MHDDGVRPVSLFQFEKGSAHLVKPLGGAAGCTDGGAMESDRSRRWCFESKRECVIVMVMMSSHPLSNVKGVGTPSQTPWWGGWVYRRWVDGVRVVSGDVILARQCMVVLVVVSTFPLFN